MTPFDEARLTDAIIELRLLRADALYREIPWYRRIFVEKPNVDAIRADAIEHANLIILFHKKQVDAV